VNAILPRRVLFAYGLLGMPLAMAALPLYVHLPKFYGDNLGVNLTALGTLLLLLRLADGVIDPLAGAWSDRIAARSGTRKTLLACCVPVLALGMVMLFHPPRASETGLLAWLAAGLIVVYGAFSLAMINHSAWGAELSPEPLQRTRVTATREGLGLAGVVIAAVAPSVIDGADVSNGLRHFSLIFALLALVCATVTLSTAPSGITHPGTSAGFVSKLRAPLTDRVFLRLLLVFLANGIAAAIPATLVLFFIADVLQAERWSGAFLALYFLAGAAGMPLWVIASHHLGKTGAWLVGMVLSIIAFAWVSLLGAGDVAAYAAVCVLSGLCLGADLALPPSLLADVVGRESAASTGAYFGVWTLATKLNLALAAGIALPLLQGLGYRPGTTNTAALHALTLVYALVPSVLKVGAIVALRGFRRSLKGGSIS
jgi:glycoside/pentoside/hexuronide:cation symporter, GPH family